MQGQNRLCHNNCSFSQQGYSRSRENLFLSSDVCEGKWPRVSRPYLSLAAKPTSHQPPTFKQHTVPYPHFSPLSLLPFEGGRKKKKRKRRRDISQPCLHTEQRQRNLHQLRLLPLMHPRMTTPLLLKNCLKQMASSPHPSLPTVWCYKIRPTARPPLMICPFRFHPRYSNIRSYQSMSSAIHHKTKLVPFLSFFISQRV